MIASVGRVRAGKGIDIGDDASRQQAGRAQDCPGRQDRTEENAKEENERSAHASRGKGERCSVPVQGMRAHISNACPT